MAPIRLAPLVRASGIPSRAPLSFSRAASTDLVIGHRNDPSRSAQPIIKKGPPTGGRSSSSGHTVTVFGCTGFLGRYLVHRLGKQGCQVVIPYRDEDEKRHLRVMGDLGQIVPMEWDARNPDQIYECVKHSDTVFNLVGRDHETRNYKYHDVNVKTAQSIAQVATHANVNRLIHVSHLNAAPDSPSQFYKTKYEGERAVRDAFPEATIVRPGPLFGYEDWLLNAAGRYPALFKLNGGQTRILPVHVTDVVSAITTMLNAPITSTASTFVLPGPESFTYSELLELVSFFTMRPVSKFPTVPKALAVMFATLVNRGVWWPTVSPDEIVRRYIDDTGVDAAKIRAKAAGVPSGWASETTLKVSGIDGEPVKSWAELDIEPALVEDHAIKYLRYYRPSHTYDAPVEMGHFKPRKAYHVVP